VICREPVTPAQVEIEIEFEHDGVRAPERYHFHIRCFEAWDFERGKMSPT
jgi:hypothetical protein